MRGKSASASMTPWSSSSSSSSPCSGCKFLRRKCQPECVFAPYFPPHDPHKFVNVHRVFGASNVTKILNEVQPHEREDAVNSLAYEADMRLRDPVYGCVGVISLLVHQLRRLQTELALAKSELSSVAATQPTENLEFSLSGGTGLLNTCYRDHRHYLQQEEVFERMDFDGRNNYEESLLATNNISESKGHSLNHRFKQHSTDGGGSDELYDIMDANIITSNKQKGIYSGWTESKWERENLTSYFD